MVWVPVRGYSVIDLHVWRKPFVEACLHAQSQPWSLLLPAVGSFACEIFSLNGLLCGHLVLPKDVQVGGEMAGPLHPCLSHHCGPLSLCTLLICSKQTMAAFYTSKTPLLNLSGLHTQKFRGKKMLWGSSGKNKVSMENKHNNIKWLCLLKVEEKM